MSQEQPLSSLFHRRCPPTSWRDRQASVAPPHTGGHPTALRAQGAPHSPESTQEGTPQPSAHGRAWDLFLATQLLSFRAGLKRTSGHSPNRHRGRTWLSGWREGTQAPGTRPQGEGPRTAGGEGTAAPFPQKARVKCFLTTKSMLKHRSTQKTSGSEPRGRAQGGAPRMRLPPPRLLAQRSGFQLMEVLLSLPGPVHLPLPTALP